MRISDWSSDVCSSDLCPAFSIPHKLSSADALQHRGDALTHADAHRREAELGVLVVQYMRQCAGNARTRTAERMAERDRTTADVDAVHALGELEVFPHGDRLCRERFVEFAVVDVDAIKTGTLQCPLRSAEGTVWERV